MEGASTDTLTWLLAPAAVEPEAGLTWHQAWLVIVVHDEDTVPVLPMVNGLEEGVAPPETPVKLRLAGDRERWEVEGGGGGGVPEGVTTT